MNVKQKYVDGDTVGHIFDLLDTHIMYKRSLVKGMFDSYEIISQLKGSVKPLIPAGLPPKCSGINT